MQKKNFFPIFLGLFIISLLLYFLSRGGFLNGFTGFLEDLTLPIQQSTFNIFHSSTPPSTNKSEIDKLKQKNAELEAKLVDKIKQDREIQALRDQFQTSNPKSSTLLPAKIIGMMDQQIILDKGKNDSLKIGQIVIYKNNLIGVVVKTSQRQSVLDVLTRSEKLTAKTLKTNSSGIVRVSSGNLILDNVDLSDKLEKDDFVITKGDIDSDGQGFPPDLVIGKIVSINKKASNLFQSAHVKSLVDFSKLNTVFILMQ